MSEPDSRVTERDMLDLLLQRYTNIRQGSIADRWVRAEHVRSTNISWRKTRIADFIAADNYGGDAHGSRLALHGHEVKVSRSDWLTELADPTKADAWKRYTHHWWLVVPDAAIVKPGELPEDWGLLVVGSSGALRAKVTAPRLAPEPLPLDMSITLMAAAARTAHREPLNRDAPRAWHPDGRRRCGFCGDAYPCSVHQPRALGRLVAADQDASAVAN